MSTIALPDSTVLLGRFQAIAEETRFLIVRRLASGERCVCELQHELGAAQSRLSFHLKRLKDAGVVQDRKDGRWVYYSLVPEALEEMQAFLGGVKEDGVDPCDCGDGCGTAQVFQNEAIGTG